MGDCVMETTSKFWTTPLMLKSTLGVVIGGLGITVRVKFWVTELTVLAAVKVREYVPPVPAAGVPLSTPVAASNVTPLGKAPVSLSVGVGVPVVVTVKLPAVPTVKVVLVALVIAGAWLTVRVKFWV